MVPADGANVPMGSQWDLAGLADTQMSGINRVNQECTEYPIGRISCLGTRPATGKSGH